MIQPILLPNSSKFRFNAFSTGKIVATITTNWTPVTPADHTPILAMSHPKAGSIASRHMAAQNSQKPIVLSPFAQSSFFMGRVITAAPKPKTQRASPVADTLSIHRSASQKAAMVNKAFIGM